jgi:CBS domain-containing protein
MVILHQPVSSGAGIRRGEFINGIKRTEATSNDLTSAQLVAFIIRYPFPIPAYRAFGRIIMKMKTVKDIMTPLSEYRTISMEATLYEAAMALKAAQQEFNGDHVHHRLLLIVDESGHVVGKLSQMDVLRALEPKGEHVANSRSLRRFGVSRDYLKPMLMQCRFWEQPLMDLCKAAGRLKVKRLIHTPLEGEFVDENASLAGAVHQLALEHHQSLLVTRGKEIVGILRQRDMFREVVETLSACEL